MGRWEGFHADDTYSNVLTEKREYPTTNQLKTEFGAFQKALEENRVEVLIPEFVGKFLFDQLTPRDIATVVGNQIIFCNMSKRRREYEIAGIFPLIRDFTGDEPVVLIAPVDCLIEGGDIMVNKGRMIVGLSQRTKIKGYEWLLETFTDQMEVIPVYVTDLKKDESVLHLDCAFNPVGENGALI